MAKKILEDALTDYNFDHAQMDMILFKDAVKHICNLCRILKLPSGNSFLMGVGGTGKRSCC
jgi:dynein heavy chain